MKPTTYPLRTQISLSPQLKQQIEKRGILVNEGISEYLRNAAIIRMTLEDEKSQTLKRVAASVVGSVSPKESGWRGISKISVWQRTARRDEDHHRP